MGLVDDNSFYEKAVATICNYLLSWRSANGELVQRWVNVASASQYNNGEALGKFLDVRTDQVMLLAPHDEESISIPQGHRFIIDAKCRMYERHFDPSVVVDTSRKVITYSLTRMDNVLFDYQDSGHCEFMVYQDEQHESDGYYVYDGKGYWLCDEVIKNTEEVREDSWIECDEPVVYDGLEPTIFVAHFLDSNNNEIEVQPQWIVECEFANNLTIDYEGNMISISSNKKELVNKSFNLIMSADGYTQQELEVQIKAFL